MNFINLII